MIQSSIRPLPAVNKLIVPYHGWKNREMSNAKSTGRFGLRGKVLCALLVAVVAGCGDDKAGPTVPTVFSRRAHDGSTLRFELPVAYVKARAAHLIGGSAFMVRVAYHEQQPLNVDGPFGFDAVDVFVEVRPVNVPAAPHGPSDTVQTADPGAAPGELTCCVGAADVSEYRAVNMTDDKGNRIRFVARGALIEGQHQVGILKVRYFFSPKITTNYREIDQFAMGFIQRLIVPNQ